jgi:hypothetical protein
MIGNICVIAHLWWYIIDAANAVILEYWDYYCEREKKKNLLSTRVWCRRNESTLKTKRYCSNKKQEKERAENKRSKRKQKEQTATNGDRRTGTQTEGLQTLTKDERGVFVPGISPVQMCPPHLYRMVYTGIPNTNKGYQPVQMIVFPVANYSIHNHILYLDNDNLSSQKHILLCFRLARVESIFNYFYNLYENACLNIIFIIVCFLQNL